jgi:hypothetical protein
MIAAMLAVVAVVGLVAGSLAFMLPPSLWPFRRAPGSAWSNQASVGGALLFSGIGVAGLAAIVATAGDVLGGWRSRHWVPVEATVVDSRLVVANQIRAANPGYRLVVVYRYERAGRVWESERVAFGIPASPDRDAMEREREGRFGAGAAVTVRVDPADPAEAVIEPGVQPQAGLFGALGAVFVILALGQLGALARDWTGDRLVGGGLRGKPRRNTT